MKIELTKEDYEFLKDLQNELNTQDNVYGDEVVFGEEAFGELYNKIS